MKKILFTALAAITAFNAFAQTEDGFQRVVVAEEGTGTWCSWCVRGIVALDYMHNKYPDTFIGIAIHSGDPMEVEGYISSTNFKSFPICNIDRTLTDRSVSSSTLEDSYKAMTAQATYGKVSIDAAFDSGQKNVNVNATATFSKDIQSAFNVAFVLLEDNVTGYKQANAYAGGEMGEMGGFENLPNPVGDIALNHVARGIFPSYDGYEVAACASKGEQYAYSTAIALPSTVKRKSKLSVVALLIDSATGKIINAAKCTLAGGIDEDNPGGGGTGGGGSDPGTGGQGDKDGEHNGYAYVDLGLSANWATGNMLSAESNFAQGGQEVMGGYFGWADPTGLVTSTFASDYHGDNPPAEISGTELDIAYVKWGGDWRLPTHDELIELVENTTTVPYTINGVPGLLFTSTVNGKNMFMPANGSRYGKADFYDVNTLGNYWAGTLSDDLSFGIMARYLDFDVTGAHHNYVADLFNGFGVRPVFAATAGIESGTAAAKRATKTELFTIDGRKVSAAGKGVYIERTTLSDGTTKAAKKVFR